MNNNLLIRLEKAKVDMNNTTKELKKIIELKNKEYLSSKLLIEDAIKENNKLLKENRVLNQKINKLEKDFALIKKNSETTKIISIQNDNNTLEYTDTNLENVKVINIMGNTKFCENDNGILIKKRVNLFVYNRQNNQISGKIKIKVFVCKKCNKFFINKDGIRNVYSTIDFKNNNIKFDYTKDLRKESLINILGYNTTLNRKSRLKVIQNIIIPALGAKKLKDHLIFLISLQNKNPKDFSNAISIWKSDIEFIEQNYGI